MIVEARLAWVERLSKLLDKLLYVLCEVLHSSQVQILETNC